MKGRLYFATKAQKDGKILIKTHPCAQIFCCDICGFEKVFHVCRSINAVGRQDAQIGSYHWMALQSKNRGSDLSLTVDAEGTCVVMLFCRWMQNSTTAS